MQHRVILRIGKTCEAEDAREHNDRSALERRKQLKRAASRRYPSTARFLPLRGETQSAESLAAILFMAAIAAYGFYTSLGGQPLFGGAVLEE